RIAGQRASSASSVSRDASVVARSAGRSAISHPASTTGRSFAKRTSSSSRRAAGSGSPPTLCQARHAVSNNAARTSPTPPSTSRTSRPGTLANDGASVATIAHGGYGNVSARRTAVQIGVDIGGTFTDIVALDGEGRLAIAKVPSTPKDLLDGIGAAVVKGLALAGARPDDIERFIHGTTIATNPPLEREGAVS